MVLQEDIYNLPSLSPQKEDISTRSTINWGEYLKEGWEQFQFAQDEVIKFYYLKFIVRINYVLCYFDSMPLCANLHSFFMS